MKYAFIQEHRQEFRLTRLCQTLQVSRSGYYAWQRRPESRRAQQNRDLLAHMQVLHQQTLEAYGGSPEDVAPIEAGGVCLWAASGRSSSPDGRHGHPTAPTVCADDPSPT